VDPDEIGGSCPRCDGEFEVGVTECPDCGIPLVGAGEAAPPGPPGPPVGPPGAVVLDLDDRWPDRLVAVAVVAAATVVLQLAGALLAVLTSPRADGFASSTASHDRVRSIVQVATPGLATIVLVGAIAVAGARYLGDARDWAALVAAGAATVTAALAVAGAVTDVLWRDERGGFDDLWSTVLSRLAVLVITVVAAWLTDAWTPRAPVEVVG
jgi:hypothetical protein